MGRPSRRAPARRGVNFRLDGDACSSSLADDGSGVVRAITGFLTVCRMWVLFTAARAAGRVLQAAILRHDAVLDPPAEVSASVGAVGASEAPALDADRAPSAEAVFGRGGQLGQLRSGLDAAFNRGRGGWRS
jgi:hypothetical protein